MSDTPHKMVQDLVDKTFRLGVINIEMAIAQAAKDEETVERVRKAHADLSHELETLANEIVSRMRYDV